MAQMYVNIALPVPINQLFTYSVPLELEQHIAIGKRVLVPFGKKILTGVIVEVPSVPPQISLKSLIDIVDDQPTYSPELLQLTHWMSDYYLTPWGEILRAAVPQGLFQESFTLVRLLAQNPDELLHQLPTTARAQKAILKSLALTPVQKTSRLRKNTKVCALYPALKELRERGWIIMETMLERSTYRPKLERTLTITHAGLEALTRRTLPQKYLHILELLSKNTKDGNNVLSLQQFLKIHSISLSTIRTLHKKLLVHIAEREVSREDEFKYIPARSDILLNEHQQQAIASLRRALEAHKYRAFLLHGVTGSGKTQVYIEAIRKTLELGKTALVLVPEISLTPQTVDRFKSHFGENVAVTHSQLPARQRYDVWYRARQGSIRIVIGPRSVIFSPLQNIGLIVIDEEHESSYKQYDAIPRYNARDVALVRAWQSNAVVVLGSATPSIESYYNAQQGKYTLLELPHRVDTAQLPRVMLVDMRTERKRIFEEIKTKVQSTGAPFPKRFPQSSLSSFLRQHIQQRLEAHEGVILMINRRGFSHVMECYECGHVEKCPNCDVTLTYHSTKKHLRCHYCGFVKDPPTLCPHCGGVELRFHAFGTQQVEEELATLFPTAKIVRMDRDTTTRKGAHHRILRMFEAGEADILLGTQMVAKGLDFPRVTLVGVVSADTQMLLPDFRASENTFQLLTQVAGRAGRSIVPGEVIIQTLQPDHYSLKHVLTHDYLGFYTEELAYRQELKYPPISRLVLIEFVGTNEDSTYEHASIVAQHLHSLNEGKYDVLGPADAAIPKIKNRYRKHVIVKSYKHLDPNGSHLRCVLRTMLTHYETSSLSAKHSVKMIIDIDPQGLI
ncbi:MAG: primosomal protein N' [Bacteroidetes bacterium]|nr:primosomal protein N' [Bacteroidota bacterium]